MVRVRPSMLSAAVIGLALGLGYMPATSAQSYETREFAQLEFSEQEIRSFAQAWVEIAQIDQQYQPRIQAAETSEERERLQQRAMDSMIDAVENTGLSVDTYSEIHAASQMDPQLAGQINSYVQQMQGSQQ